MKKILLFLLLAAVLLIPTRVYAVEAEPVIIDTDFASDGDDILALRLAMIYDSYGFTDIKGVALSTCYSRTPKAVTALMQYDNFIPVPIAMDDKRPVHVNTNYVDVMAECGGYGGYEDPVGMYRRILAESEEKVNILTLGFLQNIRNLMESQPDDHSPLTGMELIREKVDTLYILGGNLSNNPSFNLYYTGDYIVQSAQIVNDGFPADIVWLPTELGGDVWNGAFYRGNDYRQKDIATKALIANHQGSGICGWDTMGVYAMIHDMQYNLEVEGMGKFSGKMSISDDGRAMWNFGDIPGRYIILKSNTGEYYSGKIDSLLWQKFKSNQ